MSPKPMELKKYEKWIDKYGWTLDKAGKDWKLRDEHGKLVVLNIIITHPGKPHVIFSSVKKTKEALRLADKE